MVKGFIEGVRSEVRKVTWPSREETLQTTLAVVVLVFSFTLYFVLADTVIFATLRKLLGL